MKYLTKACAFVPSPKVDLHGTRIFEHVAAAWVQSGTTALGQPQVQQAPLEPRAQQQSTTETLCICLWDPEHLC